MSLQSATEITLNRFAENPLITPDSDDRIGTNINGPSVIQTPEWLDEPLGEYYLYFANHGGSYIRLAYADALRGPWSVYQPGTLHRNATRFDDHIASPDVHVDHEEERIRMYFHGCCGPFEHENATFGQATDVATSSDGRHFEVRGETLGNSYFRTWEYGGQYYALANDGHLYRGSDPLSTFERRQELFPRNRHFAVRFLERDLLQVFLTRRGDRPERLMVSLIDLSPPDEEWRADPHPPETVLWPERDYEGGDRPARTSNAGPVDGPVRALRDPAIYEEGDRTYLFYAVAGERGIACAEVQ